MSPQCFLSNAQLWASRSQTTFSKIFFFLHCESVCTALTRSAVQVAETVALSVLKYEACLLVAQEMKRQQGWLIALR